MRNKAISTIIATILILMITITLAGTSYLFISGTLTGKTATAFEIVDSYGDTVIIRNIGTEPITSFRSAKLDTEDAIYRVDKQDSSLVGYWKMDELNQTGALDSSGKGNQGTFTGEIFNDGTIYGATFTNGQYGNALNFDGNDYVTNTNPSNLPTGNSDTITAWIKPNSVQADSTYNGIVSYGPRACTGTSLLLSLQSNGRPSMATWCNDFVPISGPAVNWNQWNFVAVVLNGQSVTLYVNDQSVSGTLSFLPNIQSGVLNIGMTDNPGRYFNGVIDEVRIYNRALAPSEIQADMNSPHPVDRTVASYSFEEVSGSTAYDTHNRVAGRYGNALSFDGSNDYVEIGTQLIPPSQVSFTVSAWMNPTTLKRAVITGESQTGSAVFELATESNGAIYFGWAGCGNINTDSPRTFVASVGNWYNVVGVFNSGGNSYIYINGDQKAEGSFSLCLPSITFKIGYGADGYFNGPIDEVKIYNKALSAQEVKADYNLGSQINAGETATIKIYNQLSKGMHTLRLCTSSMCNTAYLTII